MNSSLWKLNSSDFIKGLVIAVATPIVTALAHAMNIPGFDFASFDWKSMIAIGLAAAFTYLLKNFASDSNGAVLGVAGGK